MKILHFPTLSLLLGLLILGAMPANAQYDGPNDTGGWVNIRQNVGIQMNGPMAAWVTFEIYGFSKCFQTIGDDITVDWTTMFENLYDHEDMYYSWYEFVTIASGYHAQAWTHRTHGDYTEEWMLHDSNETIAAERRNQYDVYQEEVLEYDVW